MSAKKKFVVLQGLAERNRFFTSHVPGTDPTKLDDGTLAYRILGYAHSVEEAQVMLYGKAQKPVTPAD
jgi:hypothetical protein